MPDFLCGLDARQALHAGADNLVLGIKVERGTHGVAEGVIDKQPARRPAGFDDVEGAAKDYRGDTFGFQMTGDQTHGLMAHGSHGDKEGCIYLLGTKISRQIRDQFFDHPALGIYAAHA